MYKIVFKITVFFENPFWVCVLENNVNGSYDVCKITFGAEPKDYEIYDFMLKNFSKLKFSSSIENSAIAEKRINYKRMLRLVKKQTQNNGIGTKAQQTLKLQQEQNKLERKSISREQREMEKEQQFVLRQEKHKEKHRGH